MPILDNIADEISSIVQAGFKEVRERTSQGGQDVLLRRFRSQYGILSLEEITAIQDALGHQTGEDSPCPVCRISAQEEFKRSED